MDGDGLQRLSIYISNANGDQSDPICGPKQNCKSVMPKVTRVSVRVTVGVTVRVGVRTDLTSCSPSLLQVAKANSMGARLAELMAAEADVPACEAAAEAEA